MQLLKHYGLTWDTLLEIDIKNNPNRKTFVIPMTWVTESVKIHLEDTFDVFYPTCNYDDFGDDAVMIFDGHRVGQNLIRNMREWITCSEPSLNKYEQPKLKHETFLVFCRKPKYHGPTILEINKL